jgi:hypothetical protein
MIDGVCCGERGEAAKGQVAAEQAMHRRVQLYERMVEVGFTTPEELARVKAERAAF